MTQEERVVKYVEEFGSITPFDAFRDLGVTKLATVVSRLIHKYGYTVKKEKVHITNRYGEKIWYMKYSELKRRD